MRTMEAEALREIGASLFQGAGSDAQEARLVAGELVEANLAGLDSHGIVRCVMYVDQVLDGTILPGVAPRVVKETPAVSVVDCGRGYGIRSALGIVEVVAAKARSTGLACAASLHCNHVGRLGGYVARLASLGLFGLATVNSPRHGHFVAPWGGREGRLSTNPLAWAAPTDGRPLLHDMSTSMIAEGKIRILMQEGKPLPVGYVLDAEGRPTTDPGAFYGPPRGTILPFGSPELGYKGFGLSLMVELLGAALAGEALVEAGAQPAYGNGFFLLALDPAATCGRDRFRGLVTQLAEYIRTSRPAPGSRGVLLPGELEAQTRERRLAEGIPVADGTWEELRGAGRKVGVSL